MKDFQLQFVTSKIFNFDDCDDDDSFISLTIPKFDDDDTDPTSKRADNP